MVLVDALIIGGGPAGVSAALTLARQAQSSIVFDSGKYRNDATDYMHMVPAFDHSSPVEYRAAARSNIASRYDHVTFADIEIDTVTKAEDGTFRASSRGSPQSWQGKKVILASGVKDIFPNIEGYQDCWGKSLFHCLFCKGFEQRGGDSAGVLAIDDMQKAPLALHVARQASALAKSVTIYTNSSHMAAQNLEAALGSGSRVMKVENRAIKSLSMGPENSGLTVTFTDGSCKQESFVAHAPLTKPTGPFVDQLGLETAPNGDIKVSPPFNHSSVPGVFIAGDACSLLKTVPNAILSGTLAGTGASSQILAESLGQKPLFG